MTANISSPDPSRPALTITAFEGSCGSLIEVDCLEPGLITPPTLRVDPGVTYYFLAHLRDMEDPGLLTANLSFDCVPVPPNDDCENATIVTETDAAFGADIAAASEDGTASCSGIGQTVFSSVWYTFTTGDAGDLTVSDGALQSPV